MAHTMGRKTMMEAGRVSLTGELQKMLQTFPAIATENRIKVGDRVIIGSTQLRGIVKFVGGTEFSSGDWIGVALNEPAGKNDGSVKGVRYFECQPNYGLFVRPTNVVMEEGEASDSDYVEGRHQVPEDLKGLKFGDLKKKAKDEHISEKQLEEILDDAYEPKQVLLELIVDARKKNIRAQENQANQEWLKSLLASLRIVQDEIGPPGWNSQKPIARSGMSADVYSGTWTSRKGGVALKKEVAIKCFRGDTQEDLCDSNVRELAIGYMLRHPNLVSCFGVLFSDGLGLVMEYVGGGTLHDALFRAEGWTPLLESRRRWLNNVVDAMVFVHAHGVVHNDLKGQNVLLTCRTNDGSEAKVCDLGLWSNSISLVSSAEQVGSFSGTRGFKAPETYIMKPHRRSDVFSFAMLLYETLTRKKVSIKQEDVWDPEWAKIPWHEVRGDLAQWVKEHPLKGRRPKIPNNMDAKDEELINRCWLDDYLERPTFERIKGELAGGAVPRPTPRKFTLEQLLTATLLEIKVTCEWWHCSEHAGVSCRWFNLPTSLQTHEIAFVLTTEGIYLFVTQLTESMLIRIEFEIDAKGDLIHCDPPRMWRIGPTFEQLYGEQRAEFDKFGLLETHNLSKSIRFPGFLWISIQAVNKLMLLKAANPFNEQGKPCAVVSLPDSIELANEKRWIGGPHCVRELENGTLLTTQKGSDPSSTRSMFRERSRDLCKCCEKDFHEINASMVHQIRKQKFDLIKETWAVVETKLPECSMDSEGQVFDHQCHRVVPSGRSPPMVDYFNDGVAIASQDMELDYLVIRPEHSSKPYIPTCNLPENELPSAVGVVASPDRECIFIALLGRSASLCRVPKKNPHQAVVHHFPEITYDAKGHTTPKGVRFIHVAFDQENTYGFRVYALSSSLLDEDGVVDAVVAMEFENDAYDKITRLAIIPLGIACKAHRILCEYVNKKSYLFITAFSKSQVRQFSNLGQIKMRPVKAEEVSGSEIRYSVDWNTVAQTHDELLEVGET